MRDDEDMETLADNTRWQVPSNRQNHSMKWTQEEDDMLRRVVLVERKSFGVAARELAQAFRKSAVTFTRNACISRAHRLGLGGRTKQEDKRYNKDPSTRSPDKRKNHPAAPNMPLVRIARPIRSINEHPVTAYTPPARTRTLELVDGTCQFIGRESNAVKCSNPCDGQTNWCEEHRRLCYQPMKYDPNPKPMPGLRRW